MAQAVMEFLCSTPGVQHLPVKVLQSIAQASEIQVYDPSEMETVPDGAYVVWSGELVTRKERKILKRGDYAAGNEIRDATAESQVKLLALSSKVAELVKTKSMWNATENEQDVCMVERIMSLERLATDVYLGSYPKELLTFGRMFGGQLVAQALAAASKSVNPFLLPHSLHSYFLRAGDPGVPVTYSVQRYQESRNFANRYVSASQNDEIIFTMTASFQREEDGLEHQLPMPSAPKPDEVLPEEILFENYISDSRIPLSKKKIIKTNLSKERPLEFRYCDALDKVQPPPDEPREKVWFKAKGELSDDQVLHRCVAAFATDWFFLECALRPHALTSGPDGVFNLGEPSDSFMMLSLDHSIWFHKPMKADNWLLFSMESPRMASARALAVGHIYSQNGELLASATQEGLIRKRRVASKL